MSASPRFGVKQAAPLAIAALAAWSSATTCSAQYRNDFDGPFPDVSDYQWFEPVDIDLDRLPVRKNSGLHFSYEKFAWTVSSERVTIGDPNALVVSEVIYAGNSLAANDLLGQLPPFLLAPTDPRLANPETGQPNLIPVSPTNSQLAVPPDPYVIENGLAETPPDATFGWGDRYEFGYADDQGNGWSIGVLDGNKNESEQVYGAEFVDPLTGLTENGFGSIHVNFAVASEFLLVGFRDYGDAADLDETSGGDAVDDVFGGIGPTIQGPGAVAVILTDELIDDILTNGGTNFVVDADGDGEFTPGVDFLLVDYGDLHEFNIRFDFLGIRNITKIDGVELMRSHVLSNRHWMKKHQNQHLEFGYGVRLFMFKDQFLFDGNSDLLGRTFSFTEAENQIVGPQLRLKWATQRDRFSFSVDGRVMLGYNIQDLSQENGIGSGLSPGALNRSLLLQPTTTTHGRQDTDFSPMVELRADAKYQITRSMALTLGYTGTFVDSVTRAAPLVEYRLPDMGIGQGGQEEVFVNGVNFGVEFWH